MDEVALQIQEAVDELLEYDPLQISKENAEEIIMEEILGLFTPFWDAMQLFTNEEEKRSMVFHLVHLKLKRIEPCRHDKIFATLLEKEQEEEKAAERWRHVQTFFSLPNFLQKSREWYLQRLSMFTASNLSKLFNSEAQYNSLIYEKCCPIKTEEDVYLSLWRYGPREHGTKFEPISCKLYQEMYQVTFSYFGCLTNPNIPFIGASPDAIITSAVNNPCLIGRVVEIKNPISREMEATTSEQYWIQMQTILAVTQLEECELFETKFQLLSPANFFAEPKEKIARGVILHMYNPSCFYPNVKVVKEGEEEEKKLEPQFYAYMDIEFAGLEQEEYETKIGAWKQKVLQENPLYQINEECFWELEDFHSLLIRRNDAWFAAAYPVMKKAWEVVERERVSGEYTKRAPISRKRKVEVAKECADMGQEE